MYTQLSAAMMSELSGVQDADDIAETVEEDWARDAKGARLPPSPPTSHTSEMAST